ncbi:MAG: hypothetical protein V4621_01875 [Pseudomonadota bacterium]
MLFASDHDTSETLETTFVSPQATPDALNDLVRQAQGLLQSESTTIDQPRAWDVVRLAVDFGLVMRDSVQPYRQNELFKIDAGFLSYVWQQAQCALTTGQVSHAPWQGGQCFRHDMD